MSHLKDARLRYEPRFWSRTTWIQIGYGVWVNQVLVAVGLALGFIAVALPQMKEDFPINYNINWIAGALLLTAPVGCLFCGVLMDRIGRRPMLIACMIPMAIGWFVLAFSTNSKLVIVGIVITGVGVGMASSPSRAYCAEMSLPVIRGVIGVFPVVGLSLGITFEAFFGSRVKWRTLCYIGGGYSLVVAFLNIFLPESPYFMLMESPLNETKRTLKKFRCKQHQIDAEMAELWNFKQENNIRRLTLKGSFKLLFTASACRPFFCIVAYIIIGQLAGICIIMYYVAEMLEDENITLNPYMGNTMLGLSMLTGGLTSAILTYNTHRRHLAMVSAGGVSTICIFLGIYLQNTNFYSMFPQIAYILYMIFASLGYVALPMLMLFEMIPLQIRGLLGGITVSIWHLTIIATIAAYHTVKSALGYPQTVIIFGVFSLLGFAIIYFWLPETKGLTLPEIEEYFNSRREFLPRARDPYPVLSKKTTSQKGLHRRSVDLFKITHGNEDINKEFNLSLDSKTSILRSPSRQLNRRKSSVAFLLDDIDKSSIADNKSIDSHVSENKASTSKDINVDESKNDDKSENKSNASDNTSNVSENKSNASDNTSNVSENKSNSSENMSTMSDDKSNKSKSAAKTITFANRRSSS